MHAAHLHQVPFPSTREIATRHMATGVELSSCPYDVPLKKVQDDIWKKYSSSYCREITEGDSGDLYLRLAARDLEVYLNKVAKDKETCPCVSCLRLRK